jgi:hypothetical protein
MTSGLSATTTASKLCGNAAENFRTASASDPRGGKHSAVTILRPDINASANLLIAAFLVANRFFKVKTAV